jgi:hypothetical protein
MHSGAHCSQLRLGLHLIVGQPLIPRIMYLSLVGMAGEFDLAVALLLDNFIRRRRPLVSFPDRLAGQQLH